MEVKTSNTYYKSPQPFSHTPEVQSCTPFTNYPLFTQAGITILIIAILSLHSWFLLTATIIVYSDGKLGPIEIIRTAVSFISMIYIISEVFCTVSLYTLFFKVFGLFVGQFFVAIFCWYFFYNDVSFFKFIGVL